MNVIPVEVLDKVTRDMNLEGPHTHGMCPHLTSDTTTYYSHLPSTFLVPGTTT